MGRKRTPLVCFSFRFLLLFIFFNIFHCFFLLFLLFFFCFFLCFVVVKRPQEGFHHGEVLSVVHSRILWWLESWQDFFHPSPGIFRFPLVRQEDAPFFELFFAPLPRRGWHEEFELSDDSDELSDF